MSGYDWRLVPMPSTSGDPASAVRREASSPAAQKPHMLRRSGETVSEWCARLAWSCYLCGQEFERGQRQALNDHEDEHSH